MVKGVIVTAPKSGSGKTIATLAIMKMLTTKGIKVAPFKIGPDFIDPSHYEYICGVSGRNLDSFMMDQSFLNWNIHRGLNGRDCAVIEGVMGLFDGYGEESLGSTAEIAKKMNLPVVLVVDAKGSSQSILPVIYGFLNWDKQLTIHGVIINKLNSIEHYKNLKNKIEQMGIKCLGFIPNLKELSIEERHLGLKLGFERSKSLDEGLSKVIGSLEIEKIISLIESSGTYIKKENLKKEQDYPLDIFIAKDKAFSFIYQEHIDLFGFYGCRIHYFSPMEKEKIESADLIYFPGGYPELYGKELSQNISLLNNIKEHSEKGTHIFGECGGLIYLSDRILTENNVYNMVGVFPFKISMQTKFKSLGYVDVTVKNKNPLFVEGTRFKGHRFHYSKIDNEKDFILEKTFTLQRKNTIEEEGYAYKNTLASYVHIHFGSNVSGLEDMLKKLLLKKQKAKGIKEFI